MSNFDETALDQMIKLFGEDEIRETLIEDDFTKYQTDPVGFLRNVLGVKHIYSDLVKICESIVQNKTTIAQSANGTGKTWLLAHVAIWFYLCFPQSQVIIIAAPPESNLKEKAFSEVLDIIYKNKKLFKNHVVTTLKVSEGLSLKSDSDEGSNKHFIVGKSIPTAGTSDERKAKFSGAHAPQLLALVDEASGVPDEIFDALDGCLSGDMNKMFCTLNPRAKSGACWEMTKTGRANVITMSALAHPNVTEGRDVIPGAVSRDKTIQRIIEWTAPLRDDEDPDLNCFEVPDFLVGAVGISSSGKAYPKLESGWRRITTPAFATISLGQYPSSTENSLIDERDIDAAVSRWKLYRAQYGKDATKGMSCTLGMDVADQGADDCVVAKRYGNYIEGFESWRGLDLDRSSDKLGQIYCDTDAYQANVEADGIGAAIPPKVSRMFYWKCENNECEGKGKTYLDEQIYKCPICHVDMIRKHMNARKIYVSSPSQKKCDFGKFDKLRDELAWELADWLKKEPSAMIPDDPDLREQLLAFDYYEDTNSGKIKVTDKKTIRKRLNGKSPDKFAALQQCFFEPTVPKIRVI